MNKIQGQIFPNKYIIGIIAILIVVSYYFSNNGFDIELFKERFKQRFEELF